MIHSKALRIRESCLASGSRIFHPTSSGKQGCINDPLIPQFEDQVATDRQMRLQLLKNRGFPGQKSHNQFLLTTFLRLDTGVVQPDPPIPSEIPHDAGQDPITPPGHLDGDDEFPQGSPFTALQREESSFQYPKEGLHQQHQRRHSQREGVLPRPSGKSSACRDPEGGGGGESDDPGASLHDDTGADEADTSHHLGRQSTRVSITDRKDCPGKNAEEAGADGDQGIGPNPGIVTGPLPLCAN